MVPNLFELLKFYCNVICYYRITPLEEISEDDRLHTDFGCDNNLQLIT